MKNSFGWLAIRLALFTLPIAAGWSQGSGSARAQPSVDAFAKHLERIVPLLLDSTRVPGASVGVIVDGRVAFVGGFGFADPATRRPITDGTVFNVGSISKLVSAWGVMHLVETGRVDLDAPANQYLRRWQIRSDSLAAGAITVRHLLSHTAGLSSASVPEYGPRDPVPTLADALADPVRGVGLVRQPGLEFGYSGGGYMVLQLLIEDVTGRSFTDFMRDEVLRPLGMHGAGFGWRPDMTSPAATPHDSGRAVPYFRYAGEAAASLNASTLDMLRFAAAGLPGPADSASATLLLRPETVALMQMPQPGTSQLFGAIQQGLGYALWRLNDTWSAGHAGQNTGWGAVLWTAPDTRDGLVVLTNASNGRDAWRWILCDWAAWVAETRWRGICTERPAWLPAPPTHRGTSPASAAGATRLAFVDSLLRDVRSDDPGATIIVRAGGAVIHAGGYGRTAPDSGAQLDAQTPFYIASLAKPFTAMAVLALVQDGRLTLDDSIGAFVSGLPAGGSAVPLRHLLSHSSGIPDYWDFVSLPQVRLLDNPSVVDTLRRHGARQFAAGSRHHYSNSNYVLLAEVVQRVTGRSLAVFLSERAFTPAGMTTTALMEDPSEPLPGRALGWAPDSTRFRLVDYRRIDVGGFVAPFVKTTVGDGGIVSTAADLDRWANAFFSHDLLTDSLVRTATSVQVEVAPPTSSVPDLLGYGFGWYVSRRYGDRVVWHDGDFAGFHTILAHVPSYDVTVTILANRRDLDVRDIATRIMDRILATR